MLEVAHDQASDTAASTASATSTASSYNSASSNDSVLHDSATLILDIDPTLERILDMLHQQNKTDKELITYLGLANGSATKWKYRHGKSYFKHIKKIATFLGVSTDYLIHGSDNVTQENPTGREMNLLRLFRKMNEDDRNCLIEVATRFCIK